MWTIYVWEICVSETSIYTLQNHCNDFICYVGVEKKYSNQMTAWMTGKEKKNIWVYSSTFIDIWLKL